MIQIVTHRGLDPSRKDYFLESSYEAFEDQLLRGFGLEIDIQFTKDKDIVILHDRYLTRISNGADTRAISDLTLEKLRAIPLPRGHIASLEEIMSLFFVASKRPGIKGVQLAIHVKHHEQTPEKLDVLLKTISAYDLASVLLFDITPTAAAYIKKQNSDIQLAASVAHQYDKERYGEKTGNTLLTPKEASAHKNLYSWVWLDEWDTKAPDGQLKKLYTPETFSSLRSQGFRIALVMPELHATSPGLIGEEFHEDARNPESLNARWKEILDLKPDLVCTDYPDSIRSLFSQDMPKRDSSLSFDIVKQLMLPVISHVKKKLINVYTVLSSNILSATEVSLGDFLTFHRRPFRADKCANISNIPVPAATSIVIQGPIITKRNFTLETIKLYKRIFPNVQLILSTWNNTDPRTIASLQVLGIDIVLNPKPNQSGISNINMQIVSTVQGLRKAQTSGALYVLKTRTDQRFYAPDTITYLFSLIDAFPLKIKVAQKKRLIGLGFNTFKYRPYSMSDMFLFGTIDDMLMYWDVPLDTRVFPTKPRTIREWTANQICETYFSIHFLKTLGHAPDFTIKDSWKAYRDYFCVIDHHSIDLYWYKYERAREYRRLRYDAQYSDEELSFQEWLMLYTHTTVYDAACEEILDQKFGTKIA